jgi:hypothetical protein
MVLYGFHNLQDMASARVTGSLVEATNDAINLAVAAYNDEINAMLSLFADTTTLATERYAQISDNVLQPLDNNGRALPVKPSGYNDVGYPLFSAGSAWGANYVTRVKMTVADAERATAMMIRGDRNWMRRQILAGLFSFAAYDFVDPLLGTISVKPLALASETTVTYGTVAGSAAADGHQLTQANAIGASGDNPFPLIYAELTEHPQNSGDVIVFIPTALKATTVALATFNSVADPNITPGSGSDTLTGSLGATYPGKLIGYEDSGVWIVEWTALPATHMVAVTTGGDRPLAMRQDPEPELQGFNRVADRDDHPFYESQWLRRAGFGARNRVGAVVYRVGNGTYDEPSGYTPPV